MHGHAAVGRSHATLKNGKNSLVDIFTMSDILILVSALVAYLALTYYLIRTMA